MIERRLLKNVDFVLIFVVLFIMVAGLLMIYSATRTNAWGDPFYFAKRQALWMVLSLAVVIIFLGFDYTGFPRWSSIMYLVNLGLLAAVLLVGKQALGAQSWIQVGPFVVQPSEFAKIMIILTLANHLARYEGRIETWWDFLSPFIHVGVPVLLILRQPDLGTALVFLAILFGMLFVAGAPLGRLLGVFGGGLALAVGAIVGHLKYGWWIPLKDYQLKRLIVFVDPGVDPMGAGYHIIQSRIAIGSGGILGKGLFAGTQNQLDFLPERHTDFIFSVIGEELGFVGGFTPGSAFRPALERNHHCVKG